MTTIGYGDTLPLTTGLFVCFYFYNYFKIIQIALRKIGLIRHLAK